MYNAGVHQCYLALGNLDVIGSECCQFSTLSWLKSSSWLLLTPMEFNFSSRSLTPAFCCTYLGSSPNSTRTPYTLSRDLTLRHKWGVDAPTCGFGLEGRMRTEGWGGRWAQREANWVYLAEWKQPGVWGSAEWKVNSMQWMCKIKHLKGRKRGEGRKKGRKEGKESTKGARKEVLQGSTHRVGKLSHHGTGERTTMRQAPVVPTIWTKTVSCPDLWWGRSCYQS